MRTLRDKYLSGIPLDEDHYKVDFTILDKYQLFSSELLRLSLLGLAIYGFFIGNVIIKTVDGNQYIFLRLFVSNKLIFILGAVSLLLSALLALGHRYFSTDCMTHFVRRFRLRKRIDELAEAGVNTDDERDEITKLEKKAQSENSSFENDLWRCKWLLVFSCGILVIGIALVIGGLGKTLIEATESMAR
jgi:hypothetical protein